MGFRGFEQTRYLPLSLGWMATENIQYLSMLRFCNRLLKLPENRLTKRIFIDIFYLVQSGHENWCSNVFKILEFYH